MSQKINRNCGRLFTEAGLMLQDNRIKDYNVSIFGYLSNRIHYSNNIIMTLATFEDAALKH